MGEVEEPTFLKTPIWYLKIRSKVTKRSDRLLFGLFIPAIIAYVIVYYIWLALISYNKSIYIFYITAILFILVFSIFYYLTWRIYITRNAKCDRFDLFAYLCGSVSIELDRLSVIPDYNDYLGNNIFALQRITKSIKRKYKAPDDKVIKESLEAFSNNLEKTLIWLKNPEVHKTNFSELSAKFIDLGTYVINVHRPRIDANFVNRITDSIKDIPGGGSKSEAIYEYAKKFVYSRKGVILGLDVLFSVITYFVSINYVSKEWAVSYAIVVFIGFPTLLRELK